MRAATNSGSLSPGLIVAALILPPLAIFLAEGLTRNFWIGLGLTCLGYVPGIAFALFTLTRKPPAPPQAAA